MLKEQKELPRNNRKDINNDKKVKVLNQDALKLKESP